MSFRIGSNAVSLSAYSNLNRTSNNLSHSIGKLSSGRRINSASDDAAGLAISEKMRSQISGLNRARLNAQDGASMIQTAEGGLGETQSIIQRMRELAIQGSNDTLTSNDRLEIQKEIKQLTSAIDDIANTTEFNTKKLLNGSQTAQIGATTASVKGIVSGGDNAVGGDYDVTMKVLQGGISQMQTSQMFMNKETGALADGSTKLEDIAQFYDEKGAFALSSPQKLTVTGNANSAELTIDGKMTLNELAASLQNAIAGANGLGMKNSSAQFLESTGTTGQGGYLQITSGVIGEKGDFSIAGDQSVIDALGMSIARKSDENIVQAQVHGPEGTRTVKTSADRFSGLLSGIDLKFDSSAAQIAGNGGVVEGLNFSVASNLVFNVKSDAASAGINITVAFDVSANFSMDGIAQHINNKIQNTTAKDFGVEASVVDGQIRISYSPTNSNAPTTIDVTTGNDVLGINNGSYQGFVDGDKNMDNVIKGISQISTATGDMKVTIGDGQEDKEITFGTAVKASVIAQTGDMKEINKLVLSVNQQLEGDDVDVRMDAVNGSIAFTSTMLGQKNDASGAIQGKVVLSGSTGDLDKALGYKEGIAKGNGDTNFRLHVVANNSSFQIGANEGQNMNINIGNMSAEALGIDKLDLSTTAGAQKALEKIDQALGTVSSERSRLGAFGNRLEHTMNNLESSATNLTDSESRIRDLDMASEMINFTANQILQQAGTSMLAQANMMNQSVLSLLG